MNPIIPKENVTPSLMNPSTSSNSSEGKSLWAQLGSLLKRIFSLNLSKSATLSQRVTNKSSEAKKSSILTKITDFFRSLFKCTSNPQHSQEVLLPENPETEQFLDACDELEGKSETDKELEVVKERVLNIQQHNSSNIPFKINSSSIELPNKQTPNQEMSEGEPRATQLLFLARDESLEDVKYYDCDNELINLPIAFPSIEPPNIKTLNETMCNDIKSKLPNEKDVYAAGSINILECFQIITNGRKITDWEDVGTKVSNTHEFNLIFEKQVKGTLCSGNVICEQNLNFICKKEVDGWSVTIKGVAVSWFKFSVTQLNLKFLNTRLEASDQKVKLTASYSFLPSLSKSMPFKEVRALLYAIQWE